MQIVKNIFTTAVLIYIAIGFIIEVYKIIKHKKPVADDSNN